MSPRDRPRRAPAGAAHLPSAPPEPEATGTGPRGGAPRGEPVPVHHRQIDFTVHDRDGELEVTARLRDERPWAAGTGAVEHVHDMALVVRVRQSDLTIVDARAEMSRFPHAECRLIEDAFGGLVGLSVARGYTRAVQERFGRSLGCTHLELLARMVGPVVLQGSASSLYRRAATAADGAGRDGGDWGAPEGDGEAPGGDIDASSPWLADSCHVWSTEGPGPGYQKMALGWHPGSAEYPAPPLERVRERMSPD